MDPHYNDPWFKDGWQVLATRELSLHIRKWKMYGESTFGTRVTSKQPKPAEERVKSRGQYPEVNYIIHAPEKDEHGIPIPTSYSKSDAAQTMRINGRLHRWTGTKWEPLRTIKVVTPLWRRRNIPVDLKVQHGPWWPKGHQEVTNVLRRIQEVAPAPQESLEELEEQKARDILDLIRAITNA